MRKGEQSMSESTGITFWVNGIVSARNKQPYIQLSNDKGMIGQFTVSEARSIAHDLLVMASRTEADAMILKFFEKEEMPPNLGAFVMMDFREFRSALDEEHIEKARD